VLSAHSPRTDAFAREDVAVLGLLTSVLGARWEPRIAPLVPCAELLAAKERALARPRSRVQCLLGTRRARVRKHHREGQIGQ
jgi:hypothetical protein